MTTHELKTDGAFFDVVKSGVKTFEIRLNDRGYQAGDLLVLRRWHGGSMVGCYDSTAEPIRRRVTYVLAGFGLKDGYVALGLAPESDTE